MAKGPMYIVKYRRKRKGLTNYHKRLRLLKSEKPRLVVRRSSNNTICQVIKYVRDGDKTVASFDSLKLRKYDYKGHCGNIPASYLAGYACGLKAKKAGINEAVLDTGLYRSVKGSRIYAALKGFVDAGVNVEHDEGILPEERRTQGYHIANYASILQKEKPEEYEKIYFQVLKRGLKPEEFVEHFNETKKRLTSEFSGGNISAKKSEGEEQ